MRYFTLAVYNDDRRQHETSVAYIRHLDNMEGILPRDVLELARMPGVDDGLVAEVRHNADQRVLTLTLRCGELQMGYFDLELRYVNAGILPEDARTLARIARTTRNADCYESEVCVHELDVTGDGRIEHSFLFHPGISFAIYCRALTWERNPRPTRNLPRLRDRFPSGPAVA
jgi:hypothetical protein